MGWKIMHAAVNKWCQIKLTFYEIVLEVIVKCPLLWWYFVLLRSDPTMLLNKSSSGLLGLIPDIKLKFVWGPGELDQHLCGPFRAHYRFLWPDAGWIQKWNHPAALANPRVMKKGGWFTGKWKISVRGILDSTSDHSKERWDSVTAYDKYFDRHQSDVKDYAGSLDNTSHVKMEQAVTNAKTCIDPVDWWTGCAILEGVWILYGQIELSHVRKWSCVNRISGVPFFPKSEIGLVDPSSRRQMMKIKG